MKNRILLFVLSFLAFQGEAQTNILFNPGFDAPALANGENYTGSNIFNGWTMTGGPFNVIRPNGSYGGGPDNAQDGAQFIEVYYAAGTVYQDFTIDIPNTAIEFGGYFSSRTGNSYTGVVKIYSMPSNTLVGTSSSVQIGIGDRKTWRNVVGNVTLPVGKYRYVAYIDDDGNFDAAYVLGVVNALPCIWDGSVDNWSDDTKWFCGHAPTTGEDAFIYNGTVTLSGAEVQIANLTLSAATLTGDKNITLSGGLDWGGGTISGTGTMTVVGTTTITNEVTLSRTFINSSTGIIKGTGTLDKTNGILINNGTIAPGASAGTLRINPSVSSTPTSFYEMEIISNQADKLESSDNIDLKGTLKVILNNPSIGIYTIFNSISGNVTGYNNLTILYSVNSGAFSPTLPPNTTIQKNATNTTVTITGSVLPIELIDFKAQNREGGNLLTWQTATEQNVSHFDIERSGDGKVFEKIAETKAQGHAATYEYLDKHPLSITDYYRLKINDLDGKTGYSNTLSIFSKDKGFTVKTYPNPVSNNLTLDMSTDKKTDITIELIDILGRQVFVKKVKNTEGVLSVPISTIGLPNGTYFLKVSDGQQTIQQKVIKN